MAIPFLREIKLYQELTNRGTTNAKKYSGLLIPVVEDMAAFLQYIKNMFPEYPDHGLEHSLRILNYVSEILSENEIKDISDSELFTFIIIALFHDTGMALYGNHCSEEIRNAHHEYSGTVIDQYFEDKMKNLSGVDRFKTVIKFACKGHGLTAKELYSDRNFSKRDKINGDQVRYALLAILIRIGDLMDLEENRVNAFVLGSFSPMYPQISLEHNLRHQNIDLYDYSPEEIRIEVHADTVEQYRIWSQWFSYLKDEILQANTYLRKYNFFFPLPETSIRNDSNYEVEDVRFEIDETGGIWKIISQSIYTDEKDFIRELLQNAIDASLSCIYRNNEIILDHVSPRSWNVEQYCKDIFVGYSERNNVFLIVDSGIGMNREELKKFLFKVSGTGYKEENNREFDFPSIAGFGIGFVSCLINASRIEIYTRKDAEEGCKVLLEDGSNLAFLQKAEMDFFVGTAIKLELKQKYTYSSIAAYIQETFAYPSVNISFVCIDDLEDAAEMLYFQEQLKNVKKFIYKFPEFFAQIRDKANRHLKKINSRSNLLMQINICSDDLIIWLEENREYDERKSDKEKVALFKEKVNALMGLGKGIEVKFPFDSKSISEKSLFLKMEDFISMLKGYRKDIVKERLRLDLDKCTIRSSNIKARKIEKEKWKYLVAFIDNNLEFSDIKILQHAIDISDKTGVLFINQNLENYDEGIEYEATNGFLFSCGEICNQIVKFVGKVQKNEFDREDQCIVIGNLGGFENVKESLTENYYNRLEDPMDDGYYGYNIDGKYEFGAIYEDIFDSIHILDNILMCSRGVSLSDLGEDNFSNRYFKEIDSNLNVISDSLIWENLRENESLYTACNQLSLTMQNNESYYYQDGIKIPCNIASLIPVGFFSIKCNCTSKARMTLNVTRHKPSELAHDIEFWGKNVGLKIQKSIISNIMNALEVFKLDINFNELSHDRMEKDSFSVYNEKQFNHLIKCK